MPKKKGGGAQAKQQPTNGASTGKSKGRRAKAKHVKGGRKENLSGRGKRKSSGGRKEKGCVWLADDEEEDAGTMAKRLYKMVGSLDAATQHSVLGAIKQAGASAKHGDAGKADREMGYCVDVYLKRGSVPPKAVAKFLKEIETRLAARAADEAVANAAGESMRAAKAAAEAARQSHAPRKYNGPRVEYEYESDEDSDSYADSLAAASSSVTPGMAMLQSVGHRAATAAGTEKESHKKKALREEQRRKEKLVQALGFSAPSYAESLVLKQEKQAAEERARLQAEEREAKQREQAMRLGQQARVQERDERLFAASRASSKADEAARRRERAAYEAVLKESRLEQEERYEQAQQLGMLDMAAQATDDGAASAQHSDGWMEISKKGQGKKNKKGRGRKGGRKSGNNRNAPVQHQPLDAGARRLAEIERAERELKEAMLASQVQQPRPSSEAEEDLRKAMEMSRREQDLQAQSRSQWDVSSPGGASSSKADDDLAIAMQRSVNDVSPEERREQAQLRLALERSAYDASSDCDPLAQALEESRRTADPLAQAIEESRRSAEAHERAVRQQGARTRLRPSARPTAMAVPAVLTLAETQIVQLRAPDDDGEAPGNDGGAGGFLFPWETEAEEEVAPTSSLSLSPQSSSWLPASASPPPTMSLGASVLAATGMPYSPPPAYSAAAPQAPLMQAQQMYQQQQQRQQIQRQRQMQMLQQQQQMQRQRQQQQQQLQQQQQQMAMAMAMQAQPPQQQAPPPRVDTGAARDKILAHLASSGGGSG